MNLLSAQFSCVMQSGKVQHRQLVGVAIFAYQRVDIVYQASVCQAGLQLSIVVSLAYYRYIQMGDANSTINLRLII